MSYIENIEKLVKRYRELRGKNIETFVENRKELAETALDIFIKIAEISNFSLETVVLESKILKEAYESMKVLSEASTIPPIPEFGDVEITNTEGTVIFVDITKSTDYFREEKNYTGFVIFNAYILLVKTITRLYRKKFKSGEFLEHTGDGTMIFYENKNLIENYGNCKSLNKKNPLCLYFIVSEHLKNYAKEKGLLDFKRKIKIYKDSPIRHLRKGSYKEPSLIHIGADYGDILEVNLGDMKKLISKTVWNAANRCKSADREVEYEEILGGKTYCKLPIKTQD